MIKFLLLFLISSCAISTIKTKHAASIKQTPSLLFRIQPNEHFDDEAFTRKFSRVLARKQIDFIIDNSKENRPDGVFIDMKVKHQNDDSLSSWKLWGWVGSIWVSWGLIPVKFNSYYQIKAKIYVNGELKKTLKAKAGYYSWIDTAFVFAAPFVKPPEEIESKVFEDLANQILGKIEVAP